MPSSSTRTALDQETFRAVRRRRAAAYRAAHPERVRADVAAYRRKHPDRIKRTKAACQKRYPLASAWWRYTSRARRRSLQWDLPRETFNQLLRHACAYCGIGPKPINGIDRVDNRLGYVASNVVTCCWQCNKMKGSLSWQEFIGHIERILRLQMPVPAASGSSLP